MVDFIDNDKLAGLYSTSRIVLKDQFEDLAGWGFAKKRRRRLT